MHSFRHRLLGLPALALLIAAAGCSSGDATASTAVPSPDTKVAGLCRNLDKVLPRTVDGLDRKDPEPPSALTAGWGSPAIILRCGVAQPPKMTDPKVARGDDPTSVGGEVDGVGWLMEKQSDGSYRFTTTLRQAYVEVTLPEERADDGASVLVDLAPAVKRAIPEGIAL
ncbi:DUF3515 domain-containing protein [Streptomyces nodosus]|uniref:DUF3515 domain-containing protein n=1 Tax=Streptomyces nodosus TaxID=40318 RepID=A0A0B5DHM5_9ACTN|nr:DUF3515 domain-containing protein [Streptomyces nodosus]AJE42699.1 lipoprotein [Streptomyces nodosus]MBB4794030.1 hypothetical protein [Streptomyces nodosus]QEV41201.1 DUF3515 domain-containing protein [Streptomyces nodosus]